MKKYIVLPVLLFGMILAGCLPEEIAVIEDPSPKFGYTREHDQESEANIVKIFNEVQTEIINESDYVFGRVEFQSENQIILKFYQVGTNENYYIYVSENSYYQIDHYWLVQDTIAEIENGDLVFMTDPTGANNFFIYLAEDNGVTEIDSNIEYLHAGEAGGDYYYNKKGTNGVIRKYDGTTITDYKTIVGDSIENLDIVDDVLYITHEDSSQSDDVLIVDDLTSEQTTTTTSEIYGLIKTDDVTIIRDSSFDRKVHSLLPNGSLVDEGLYSAEPIGDSGIFFSASETRHGAENIYRVNGTAIEVALDEIEGVGFYNAIESHVTIEGVYYFILYDYDDNYYAYKIDGDEIIQIGFLSYDIEYVIINDNGAPAIYREGEDDDLELYNLDLEFIRYLKR